MVDSSKGRDGFHLSAPPPSVETAANASAPPSEGTSEAPPTGASQPVRICICMGSSCFARGNGKNTRVLKEYVERAGLDSSVELVGLLCEGKCSAGPNLQIDGRTYRGVAPSALETILDHHFPIGRGDRSP